MNMNNKNDNEIIEMLSNDISKYIKYPYAKILYNKNYILQIYNQLKKNNIIEIIKEEDAVENNKNIKNYVGTLFPLTYNNYYMTIVIRVDYEAYKKMIGLTDYFQEAARIKCVPKGGISPYDLFYNKNYNKVWIKRIVPIYKQYSGHQMDKKKFYHIIKNKFAEKIRRWCGVYPINIALTIFTMFKPKKILDMSSGWGDRLIAATMYDPNLYVGVDPNTSLIGGYKEIINTFVNSENRQKYIMINNAFEDTDLSKYDKFDIMFSSPPFFIAEEYSKDQKQSYNRYNSIEKWLNDFMYSSITKIWSHLNDNGYLVIDINDTKVDNEVVNFTEKINLFIKQLTDAKYIGVLRYRFTSQKETNPIWVWQKI
jgi:16S rRNA G966 N2-methylase RsmD